MNFISGSAIINVLRKYGELEWQRCSTIDFDDPILIKVNKIDNFRNKPHFTAWRYKNPDYNLEQILINAVKNFKGHVEWDIYFKTEGNRNGVITAKKVIEYEKLSKIIDFSAYEYLEQNEPEFGQLANLDVPNLAIHIDKHLSKYVG